MTHDSKEMAVQAGRVKRQPDENTYTPFVDVYETEDGTTVLCAEMSGASQDSIDIRVDKGVLSIRGEAPDPRVGEEYAETYRGFGGGEYFRAFALSDEIDRDKIEASYTDGVLTLRLPRAEAAQTRKIEVKPG